MELSYTLPQDSTLFVLLKKKSPHIWKHKLDWIAEHGGLALVNIHPDYIDFSGTGKAGCKYSPDLLVEFMDYIHSKYEGMYWNPLAKNLASWYRTGIVPDEVDRMNVPHSPFISKPSNS